MGIIISTVPIFKQKAGYIFSGAGILAAIIGFAAQDALSNLVAGFFIVIFKPFRVGDYIKLDKERSGIVDDITLRHTVINNFENGEDELIVVDVSTGELLSRVKVNARLANGMFLTPGFNRDIFYCTTGTFSKVTWI